MGGVFVNYRTGDGEWAAYLIAQALTRRFGAHQVFYASRSIEAGEDFRHRIETRLPGCDVLLAVIGPRWLERDAEGRRRIDDPEDWVRKEIRLAFAHRVNIIPVLLDNTRPLKADQLPGDIADLAHLHYLQVRHRERDDRDLVTLLDEVAERLPAHAVEPWRVRVSGLDGRVLGAGVLLGDRYVLTSAGLLAGPRAEVEVTFARRRHPGTVRAWTKPEWRIPADGRNGDVALLRLAGRVPRDAGTTLRRTALSWDRAVRVCGFPRGVERGVFARATLFEHGGAGEWLRMRTGPGEGQRIGPGFRGAGVVDDETGDVLGIVVGGLGEDPELSWMIPAETIPRHLPLVAGWVTGDAAADAVFSRPPAPRAGPGDHAGDERALAEWLSRRDTGDRVKIIAGPATAALYRIVTRFSRDLRPAAPDAAPEPAAGTIDLAVDASGKTAWDVARRVLSRAGIRPGDTAPTAERLRTLPPMTVVVVGVDDAARPEELLTEVLKPLADGAGRLLLGFHAESSPGLALARSWDTIGDRLARLAERLAELEAAERELMALRTRVRDPAPAGYPGAALRGALGVLRGMAARGEEHELLPLLDRCERRAARALREAAGDAARLREEARECGDLLGMLDAYQAKANDSGLAEDPEIAARYREAHGLLADPPVDLPAARAAADRHRRAVRRAVAGEEDGPRDIGLL